MISDAQAKGLVMLVTPKEIKKVIFDINEDKAPGLDDWNVVFFKKPMGDDKKSCYCSYTKLLEYRQDSSGGQ